MTVKDAYLLLKEFRVPGNIVDHSEKVMEFALEIAEKHVEKGVKIDIKSLKIACLLHDMFKVVDLSEANYKKLCEGADDCDIKKWGELRKKYAGISHPEAVAEFLKNMGEVKLARLISVHRFDSVVDLNVLPLTIEEKILTYADKRILHDKVVSLKERFSDGAKRYNISPEDFDATVYKKYFDIEKELLNELQESI